MHDAPVSLQQVQRGCLAVGIVALLADLYMVWSFGSSMSGVHGIMLCAATIAACAAEPIARFIGAAGDKATARNVMLAGWAFLAVAWFSDLGYTMGMRTESTQNASVATVAYENRQTNLAEQRGIRDVMTKRLAELQEQNGWAASKTADALRAEVAGMQLDIDQEAARGGCKSQCLKKTKALGELQGQIATLEKMDDLTKQIDATQRAIDATTETAVTTKAGHSKVHAQTDFVAKLWNAANGSDAKDVLNPDAVTLSLTDIVLAVIIATAATFVPQRLIAWAFWRPVRKEDAPAADVPSKYRSDDSRTRTVTNTVPGSFQRTDALGRRQTVTITPHAVAA